MKKIQTKAQPKALIKIKQSKEIAGMGMVRNPQIQPHCGKNNLIKY